MEMHDNQLTHPKPLVAVVDDDSSLRDSTQLLLRSAGYRAEAFASAREFLESPRIEETACLILDVRMPGMDGLELQRCLKDAQRPIPTIFITAHATEGEEERARKAGAVDFLRKPVNAEQLVGAIQTALIGSRTEERGGR